MLQIALIFGYSISVLIFALLISTLLIKAMRMSRESKYNKINSKIEPLVDNFVLGETDVGQVRNIIAGSLAEKLAVLLLIKRLALLTGEEAEKITNYIESTKFMDKTVKNTNHRNKWVRSYSAYLIGRTRGKKYISELIKLLEDKQTIVVLSASAALARIGDISAISHLLKLLDKIDSSKVHIISDHLIEITTRNFSEAVPKITLLLDSVKDNLRYWGCVILGESHAFGAIPKLKNAVKDSSPGVRSAAIEALGKMGDIDTYEYIAFGLVDPDWKVRLKAAWALGELKSPASVTALSTAVMDRQWEVNTQAVKSLLATDRSLKSFIRLLNSDYSFVRMRAAESLERAGFIDKTIENLSTATEEDLNKTVSILLDCAKNGALIPFYRNLGNSNDIVKAAVNKILQEALKSG